MSWIVLLTTGDRPDDNYAYGPFDDENTAKRFAEVMTRECDPARPHMLLSPTGQLLSLVQHLREEIIDER